MYVIRLCHVSVHLDNIQNQTGKPVSPEHKGALVRIQEQAIKLICNLLTQQETCKKVMNQNE
jgi:hypothetical protein